MSTSNSNLIFWPNYKQKSTFQHLHVKPTSIGFSLGLIATLLFLVSCSKEKESNFTAFLELQGEIRIPIDANTSGITEFVTTYTHNSPSDTVFKNKKSYLCYLNRQKDIQFYDLSSKKLVHQISFKNDGPNAIIGSITAFNIKSADSIFVSSFPIPYIFRVNLSGEVLERIELNSFNKPTEPVSSTSRPIVVTNDHIYTGFYTALPPTDRHSPLSIDELDKIILDIDLSSKSQELQYYLPDVYSKNKLFSRYYYNPSIGVGKENNQILISFGASDSISVTDFNSVERSYYAGSNLLNDIAPLNRQDAWDHYRLNYMYEGIIYDEFRNCYYRFLTLPKNEDDLKSGDLKVGRIKEIAIIILNEDFKKIGETVIDQSFSNLTYFVNKDGLNLYNIAKGLTDEDNIYYGTFKLSSL